MHIVLGTSITAFELGLDLSLLDHETLPLVSHITRLISSLL
jgi:hypothetical protein